MKFLLDNDVFFASIYAGHIHHLTARRWVDSYKKEGWGIASETYLSALRLLMNPAVMGGSPLSSKESLQAVETELSGEHPGLVYCARKRPDKKLLEKASGHRQIRDIWLIQIARETDATLVTFDSGNAKKWPEDILIPT